MPAKPKKPLVPSEAEAEIADRIWSAMSGVDGDTTAQMPAQVAASLKYLNDVGEVVTKIREEQPRLLEPYAEDLLAVVNRAVAMTEEDAAMLVMGLLSSTTLARMLADVANGTVDPIAATPRKRAAKKAAAPRRTARVTAQPDSASSEPQGAPDPEPTAAPAEAPPADPAPAPAKRAAKKAARTSAPVTAPADDPVSDPTDVPVSDPTDDPVEPPVPDSDAATVPGDFDDLPPAPVPAPAPAVAATPRAPVAVPAPPAQGRRTVAVVGEGDF